MDEEDLEPQTLRAKPTDLDPMSIEALGEYVAELEAEIDRVRAAIAAKTDHRAGVEGLFKS